jgi:C-terminal of NADH-ubiquinone oxidoreductase 21 kDa subunit
MDMEEMVAKLRAGEPLYGKSEMDLYHQQIAASQSRYAQLKFRNPPLLFPNSSYLIEDIFPFLNFSNHNQHGVDIEKYMQALREESGDKEKNEGDEQK